MTAYYGQSPTCTYRNQSRNIYLHKSYRHRGNLVHFFSTLSDAGTTTLNLELEALQHSELHYKSGNGDGYSKKEGSWEWLWKVGKATCRALLLDHTTGHADMAGG